jgi:hypothetical protein
MALCSRARVDSTKPTPLMFWTINIHIQKMNSINILYSHNSRMNQCMNKIFILMMTICLTSCSRHVSFLPENPTLHDAVVHQPYSAKINIFGAPVISPGIVLRLNPEGTGLTIKYCQIPEWRMSDKTSDTRDLNCILIQGTPVKTGIVTFVVGGGVYGSMFESPTSFDKTYTINVLDHQHIYSEDE